MKGNRSSGTSRYFTLHRTKRHMRGGGQKIHTSCGRRDKNTEKSHLEEREGRGRRGTVLVCAPDHRQVMTSVPERRLPSNSPGACSGKVQTSAIFIPRFILMVEAAVSGTELEDGKDRCLCHAVEVRLLLHRTEHQHGSDPDNTVPGEAMVATVTDGPQSVHQTIARARTSRSEHSIVSQCCVTEDQHS